MAGKRHLSGRSLRLLFALGILKGKGSGKNRTVSYDKKRAKTTSNLRKRGVDVTSRKRYRNTPGSSGRHVFGAKGAHLRGSGTGGKPKVDHSGTRTARISQVNSANSRGYLPSWYKKARNETASAIRTRRADIARTLKEAKSYEASSPKYAAELRGRAKASRDTALTMIAGTKAKYPRVAGAQLKAAIPGLKAQRQAVREKKRLTAKAKGTLDQIIAAQRRTYNGWSSDPAKQKRRYAALKSRERQLRAKYNL